MPRVNREIMGILVAAFHAEISFVAAPSRLRSRGNTTAGKFCYAVAIQPRHYRFRYPAPVIGISFRDPSDQTHRSDISLGRGVIDARRINASTPDVWVMRTCVKTVDLPDHLSDFTLPCSQGRLDVR